MATQQYSGHIHQIGAYIQVTYNCVVFICKEDVSVGIQSKGQALCAAAASALAPWI